MKTATAFLISAAGLAYGAAVLLDYLARVMESEIDGAALITEEDLA